MRLSAGDVEAAVRSDFKVVERRGDDAFGSWLLTLDGTPRLRLTFDGRDGWVALEWETDRSRYGSRQWDPLWVGKTQEDLAVPVVLRFLTSARDFAAAAAAGRRGD